MWIEERNGKFKFTERYKCPLTGKQKFVSTTSTSNSPQARKKALATLQAKIEDRLGLDPCKETLERIIGDFYAFKATYTKQITVDGGRSILLNFLKDTIPLETLLVKIGSREIQNAINHKIKLEQYSAAKKGFGELRQVLRYAYRMDILKDISFLDKVIVPKKPASKDDTAESRQKYLEPNELKDVLKAIESVHPALALVFEFQSLTGLRFGELVALRLQDYDRKKKVIDINGTLQAAGKGSDPGKRSTPKNIHSYRIVSLSDRAVAIIEHFILAGQARRMFKPKAHKTDYIFCTDGGLPFNLQFANKILRGIPSNKRLSTHIFRHTHISMLAAANVPLKAIMDRVGHNEPKTTMAVYTHVTDAMKDSVNSALNAMDTILESV